MNKLDEIIQKQRQEEHRFDRFGKIILSVMVATTAFIFGEKNHTILMLGPFSQIGLITYFYWRWQYYNRATQQRQLSIEKALSDELTLKQLAEQLAQAINNCLTWLQEPANRKRLADYLAQPDRHRWAVAAVLGDKVEIIYRE